MAQGFNGPTFNPTPLPVRFLSWDALKNKIRFPGRLSYQNSRDYFGLFLGSPSAGTENNSKIHSVPENVITRGLETMGIQVKEDRGVE